MHRSIKSALSQTGDTIVEVMFAVAVVGMVIGGSYVIATRALRTGRFAQEQTEALKQAEAQLEKLKFLAAKGTLPTNTASIFNTAGTTFCISDSFEKILSGTVGANGYVAKCTGRGAGQLYTVLVTYTAAPTIDTTDLFKITVTWDRQATSQKGNVQIAYRLHNAPSS